MTHYLLKPMYIFLDFSNDLNKQRAHLENKQYKIIIRYAILNSLLTMQCQMLSKLDNGLR